MPWRRGRGGRSCRVRLQEGRLVDSEQWDSAEGIKIHANRHNLKGMFVEYGQASSSFIENGKMVCYQLAVSEAF